MTALYKAASGRVWTRRDGKLVVPDQRTVHLSIGAPYNRTGRNVASLCGRSVWPNVVADHPGRVCRECQGEAHRRGFVLP